MLFFENKWVDGCELDNFEMKAQNLFFFIHSFHAYHTHLSQKILSQKKANDNEVKGKINEKFQI